ncbi:MULTISPECIES: helix-turn-helix transcriptional regulator [unclassified Nocardioides]|uniref:helix-turn-helix transcriptional regulator n=1 Tax=Nocardioides sp. URHA0032 TaxID=1380388 RepID=UPI001E290289|nr:response regulator transcription factor [Nocardioides sp. URHA0032]
MGLISEQSIVRAGVRTLLAAYADRVSVVDIGPEADLGEADVVLYDVLGLHQGDGKDLETAVKQHPGRVLALSRDLQPGLSARALGIGAITSISLGVGAEELVDAIEAFAAGHLEDGSRADLENRADRRRQQGRGVNLSPRELEVLGLIVQGLTNDELAGELFLSINTVKSVIRSVYRKIGVTSRSQAVAWGVEHGFPTMSTIDA